MDSRAVLVRFEVERQALAMMEHPNIAKVFDGGMTEHARPYFVMELVKGIPLTDYCDQVQFSIRERLELFGQVCSAVQHAHQKGIIHRDLKPSNVLVTEVEGRPVVKVIDFGLAKAIHGSHVLTDQSLHTAFGAVLGTPLYMAPEQLGTSALDVDTRADLYSLGVILYELLTGTTPIERQQLKQAAFEEMCRLIREQEPPRPSTRLSSSDTLPNLAVRRHVEPAKLTRLVRGELDWIVMKALEKDRNRRYETASAFGLDIQRYLTGEAVLAAPASRTYRLWKLIRKHRAPVVAAAIIALTLCLGIIATTFAMWQAQTAQQLANERLKESVAARREEAKQRESAEQQRQAAEVSKAEALKNLEYARTGNEVLAAIFLALDPREEFESAAELRSALQANVEQAAARLKELNIVDSIVAAELQNSLGTSLFQLGSYQQAIQLLEASLDTHTKELGSDHAETLTVAQNLAMAFHEAGELEQAKLRYEAILETMTSALGADHRDTLTSAHNLATCLWDLGQHAEGMALLDDVLVRRKSALGPHDEDTLATLNNLAVFLYEEGKFERLVILMEETVAGYKLTLGERHKDTLLAMSNLGMAHQTAGNIEQAIRLTQETVQGLRFKLGDDHPTTLHTLNNLGGMYWTKKQYDQAIEVFEEILPIQREKFGPTHLQTRLTVFNLGANYLASDRIEQAIPWLEEAYQTDAEKSAPLLRQTLEKLQLQLAQTAPDDVPARATIIQGLIRVHTILGDQASAEKWRTEIESPHDDSDKVDDERL